MHYSICFKNDRGLTQRSEYTRIKTDNDAIVYGRKSTADAAIVEVWRGNDLLIRLEDGDGVAPPAAHRPT